MKYACLLTALCIAIGLTAVPAVAKVRSIRLVNRAEHRVVVSISREDRKKFKSWVLEAHGKAGSSEAATFDDQDRAVIFYIDTLGCIEQKYTLHPHQHLTGFTIDKNCLVS